MAVKREFGFEKQSSELKERTDLQNSKAGKPENVDSLVSRFLAELSDLSSEMDHPSSPDSESGGTVGLKDGKINGPVSLQAQVEKPADLDRINKEIEDSLAKLEALKPAFAAPKESASPAVEEKQAEPAPMPKEEASAERATPPSPVDSDEQVWKRLEIFRSSAPQKPAPRLSIAWVLAGAVLLGVLGISAFYFFSSDNNSTPGVVAEISGEMTGSAAVPEVTGMPAASEKAPAATKTQNQKSGLPADSVRAQDEERTKTKPVLKNEPRDAARAMDTGALKNNGTAAGSESKRQPESSKADSSEKPKVVDEQPKPTATQVAAATAPPQQPIPVNTPPPAPPQPKSESSVADAAAGSPAGTGSVVVREISPAAPKPASANNTSEVSKQPAPTTAIQAEAVKRVSPIYPAIARSRKISGTVEVETEINDSGDVFRANAVSGPVPLRGAAEEALMKWKFKPASVNGVNVSSKARIRVNFSLQ